MVIEPYEDGMPEPSSYKIGGVDTKVSVKGKEEYDLPWGGKLVFYNCIVGGVIEARFMPAILKGIMEKMEEEKADLENYVNLFGYLPQFGLDGKPIGSVTYKPQPYNSKLPLYMK